MESGLRPFIIITIIAWPSELVFDRVAFAEKGERLGSRSISHYLLTSIAFARFPAGTIPALSVDQAFANQGSVLIKRLVDASR